MTALKKILSLGAACAVFSTSAFADAPIAAPKSPMTADGSAWSAHALAYECDQSLNGSKDAAFGSCIGYISGFLDGVNLTAALAQNAGDRVSTMTCKRNMSYRTFAGLVVDDMRSHPEKLETPAMVELASVLFHQPCAQ